MIGLPPERPETNAEYRAWRLWRDQQYKQWLLDQPPHPSQGPVMRFVQRILIKLGFC